jgi:hypothetical protein
MRLRARLLPVVLLAAACSESGPAIAPVLPQIGVAPEAIDFGLVEVGEAGLDEVVLTNRGRARLLLDVVRVEGPDRAAFALDVDAPDGLEAGRSNPLPLRFTPAEARPYEASLVLYHNVAGKDPVAVTLVGTGTVASEPPLPPPECTDADRDTFGAGCAAGPDCDDANPAIHPGVEDVCNGVDDDCDQQRDEDSILSTYWPDADGDGYGAASAVPVAACSPPPGHAPRGEDCDDGQRSVRPGATEVCTGGLDEDCNRLVDGADPACAVAPTRCRTQDDCGMNTNGQACPLDGSAAPVCRPICRTDAECGGGACRPLPGTSSLGYCGAAGPVAEGGPCTSASECAVGVCLVGACRKLCQTQTDCSAGEDCGVAIYDASELGGARQRRMTTACRPADGRQPIGGSCQDSPTTTDSGICNSGHCDFLAWSFGLAADAPCANVCAGSGDCAPGQVCGLVYNGFAENPVLPSTGEAAGRYFEAMFGCYTSVFQGQYLPPGTGAMGAFCDSTRAEGRLACRSHQCAQFAPIRDRCTDFCDEDADCVTPSTPNWRCRYGELSLTGIFLQMVGIADITKFTLVGVCAP